MNEICLRQTFQIPGAGSAVRVLGGVLVAQLKGSATADVQGSNFPADETSWQPLGTVTGGFAPLEFTTAFSHLRVVAAGACEVVVSSAQGGASGGSGEVIASDTTLHGLVGAANSTAPETDTAASALNGRLQRIAQRLTSLVDFFAARLGIKDTANSMSMVLASNHPDITVKSPQIVTANAVIAASASISGDVDLGTGRLARIAMPSTWTTADITFQVSYNGSVWNNLYDAYGAEYTVKAAASRGIIIPLSDFFGCAILARTQWYECDSCEPNRRRYAGFGDGALMVSPRIGAGRSLLGRPRGPIAALEAKLLALARSEKVALLYPRPNAWIERILGPNLVPNGDFSTSDISIWAGAAPTAVVNGELQVTVNQYFNFPREPPIAIEVGKNYLGRGYGRDGTHQASFSVRKEDYTVYLAGFIGAPSGRYHSGSFTAITNSAYIRCAVLGTGATVGSTAYFDNIGIHELYDVAVPVNVKLNDSTYVLIDGSAIGRVMDQSGSGYDGVQTTTADKPLLRRGPTGRWLIRYSDSTDKLNVAMPSSGTPSVLSFTYAGEVAGYFSATTSGFVLGGTQPLYDVYLTIAHPTGFSAELLSVARAFAGALSERSYP